MSFNKSINIDKPLLDRAFVLLSLTFFIFLATNNFFWEGILISLAFFMIYKMLYRIDTPVLVYAILSQFISVVIKIFYSAYTGQQLQELQSSYTSNENISEAFFLSLIGLVFLTIGISIFNKKTPAISKYKIREILMQYNPKRTLVLYIIFTFLVSALFGVRLSLPGFNFFIAQLTLIKFGFLVVTFLITHYHQKYHKFFLIILLAEFSLGFASYFSEFKNILIFGIIAYTIYISRFTLKKMAYFLILFIVVMNLAFVWNAVKSDYRFYLSGGERAQKVIVGESEALEKLYQLVTNINKEQYDQAIESTVNRLGYIDFFSLVLENVPDNIQHENGAVWKQAIQHVFMPRMFFPNKGVVDDSEHTRKYANVMVATGSMGASHSLGYMADSYIDFGKYGMFIPIFALGLFIGGVFKYLYTRRNIFWGIFYSSPFFIIINLYERNALKLFSNIVMFVLIVYLFNRFVAPYVEKYLTKKVTVNKKISKTPHIQNVLVHQEASKI